MISGAVLAGFSNNAVCQNVHQFVWDFNVAVEPPERLIQPVGPAFERLESPIPIHDLAGEWLTGSTKGILSEKICKVNPSLPTFPTTRWKLLFAPSACTC